MVKTFQKATGRQETSVAEKTFIIGGSTDVTENGVYPLFSLGPRDIILKSTLIFQRSVTNAGAYTLAFGINLPVQNLSYSDALLAPLSYVEGTEVTHTPYTGLFSSGSYRDVIMTVTNYMGFSPQEVTFVLEYITKGKAEWSEG